MYHHTTTNAKARPKKRSYRFKNSKFIRNEIIIIETKASIEGRIVIRCYTRVKIEKMVTPEYECDRYDSYF